MPEISKPPRVAMDVNGAVPSHGVYAIFARNAAAIEGLYSILMERGLARALEGVAPTLASGHVRCYERFLEAIRV